MASCLNIHADYACRHAGACCEQDWHVPVEVGLVQLVEARGLGPLEGPRFVSTAGAAGPVTALGRHRDGACVFFDRDGGRLCAIHSAAGGDTLPSACRHFPRIVLNDDRGTFIGISHFCPTAALLLLDPRSAAVVEAPPSLNLRDLEGFEARSVLPPLLRPGLLTDLDGYGAWESAAIETLARRDVTHEQALGIIAGATGRARGWRPGAGALCSWIQESFDVHANAPADPFVPGLQKQRAAALEPMSGTRFPSYAADGEQVWADGRAVLAPFERAIANYLAARLFANHTAYEAEGLLTIVEWLRTSLAVLQREAARIAGNRPAFTPADFVV
ncbi:MAG TPA: hypothetical protein VMN03_00285, partial [Burkholderiales bacterium]|nr:hypothetical protein [Burkholderiales bacterium]